MPGKLHQLGAKPLLQFRHSKQVTKQGWNLSHFFNTPQVVTKGSFKQWGKKYEASDRVGSEYDLVEQLRLSQPVDTDTGGYSSSVLFYYMITLVE